MKPYSYIIALGGAYFTVTGILGILTSTNLVEPSVNLEFFIKGYVCLVPMLSVGTHRVELLLSFDPKAAAKLPNMNSHEERGN